MGRKSASALRLVIPIPNGVPDEQYIKLKTRRLAAVPLLLYI